MKSLNSYFYPVNDEILLNKDKWEATQIGRLVDFHTNNHLEDGRLEVMTALAVREGFPLELIQIISKLPRGAYIYRSSSTRIAHAVSKQHFSHNSK